MELLKTIKTRRIDLLLFTVILRRSRRIPLYKCSLGDSSPSVQNDSGLTPLYLNKKIFAVNSNIDLHSKSFLRVVFINIVKCKSFFGLLFAKNKHGFFIRVDFLSLIFKFLHILPMLLCVVIYLFQRHFIKYFIIYL